MKTFHICSSSQGSGQGLFLLLHYLCFSLSKLLITNREFIGTYSFKTASISEERKRREQECAQLKGLVEELESACLSILKHNSCF